MQQTTNLGLNILPPEEESTTYARDLMRAIAGTDSSNMQIIDEAIKNIQEKVSTDTVWSESEPTEDIPEGSIWNEIIRID